MRFFLGLTLGLLLSGQTAKAESIVLFDAKKQCQARETAKGLRYIPPCSLAESHLTFTVPEKSQENSAAATKLNLNFFCPSLKPLSIEYQISRQENIIASGKLAPTAKSHNAHSSLSLLQAGTDYQLKLIKLNGMKGFQAIKPDCRLTLEIEESQEKALASASEY